MKSLASDENRDKNQSEIKRPTEPEKNNSKPPDDASDGFIGIEKKKRTKRFFLTGIDRNVNEPQYFSLSSPT